MAELPNVINREYLESSFQDFAEQISETFSKTEEMNGLVKDTRTIAGLDLKNNITVAALVNAIIDSIASNTALTETFSKITEAASEIDADMSPDEYILTFYLKNKGGSVISTKSIDLPLESSVIGIDYNKTEGTIKLELRNGSKTEPILVSDIVKGLVSDSVFNEKIQEINQRINGIDAPEISFETDPIDFSGYFS